MIYVVNFALTIFQIHQRSYHSDYIIFPECSHCIWGVEIKITETTDHRDYHISSQKIIDELGYQPVSSIRQEVAELRKAIEGGKFASTDDEEHYNMKFMKLERNAAAYGLLSK